MARISGVPVIPVVAGSRQAWWIEGWDRFLVPKPFAHIHLAFGRPRTIPAKATSGDLERHARELEDELGDLKAMVDG